MSLRRLSSAFRGTSDAPATDADTDFQLRSLYPEYSILEKKCDISLKENNFLQSLKSPEKKSTIPTSSFTAIHFEKSPDEVVEQLPPEYFLKDFDPIEGHLQEISSWVDDDITERFMQKIEDTDTDKDVILGHLTTMIDSNYDELMMCMTKIQDTDTYLIQAGLQSNYGRKRIKSAQELYLQGPIQIVNKTKKKKKLETIIDTIQSLKSIKDLHKSMMSNLNVGDLGQAAHLAMNVLECLKRQNFDKFHAMKGIGSSMQRTILSLRRKSDKALKRLCERKFTSLEYDSVVKAYLTLDQIEKTFKIKNVEPGYSEDGIFFDTAGCIDGLAQRIGRFQLEDVEQCLHTSVVEHIYLDEQKKHRSAMESAGHRRPSIQVDVSDLDEVPLTILLRRLSAEQLPLCIVRACELLAEIVHTHYCISQWHRAPFDTRNHEALFLHRPPADGELSFNGHDAVGQESDEDDDEVEVFTSDVLGHAAAQVAGPHLMTFDPTSSRFSSTKLAIAQLSIMQSRATLWEELLRGLISLLRATNFSSDIKLDDFVCMAWALRVMVLLGKEYCDSDSASLIACLEEKSEEYFRNFHLENFQVVRMMIDAEMWNHIPVQLQGKGAILGSIRQSFGARKVDAAQERRSLSKAPRSDESLEGQGTTPSSNGVADDASSSVLSSFSVSGNPLKFIMRTDVGDATIERMSSLDEAEEVGAAVSTPRFVRQALQMWDNDGDDEEESNAQKSRRQRDADRSSYLITQTSFNGLGKSLSKYMQMMQLIPSAASEIFDSLCELLDFYLCAVFFGFVPLEERGKFFGTPNKMTSAAPDHRRDYEILKDYVSRAFSETVHVPKGQADGALGEDLGETSDHTSNHCGRHPTAPHDTTKVFNLLKVPSVVHESTADSCFALNQRIVAAESCWFVAQMLLEAKTVLQRLLPDKLHDKCATYASDFSLVIGQLRALLYKINGPLLIDYAKMLTMIVDCGWESKKLTQDHHHWVDDLIDHCKDVWDYMMLTDQFAEASSLVREQVWMELCSAAFDVTLEGYSRVKKCTPEGRAGMIMDVFALHDGLNSIHLCRCPRGKHYVDSYLQAFCLNEEDLMVWIQENYQTYAYRHIVGMLNQTLSSMLNNKKLRDAVAVIDQLYEIDEKEQGSNGSASFNKFSNMLSTRFMEDGKISNLIAGKFRK